MEHTFRTITVTDWGRSLKMARARRAGAGERMAKQIKEDKKMDTTETKYDASYFIAKFEAIPEEKWCTDGFTNDAGQCCAAGHCGLRNDSDWTPGMEAYALDQIFDDLDVVSVNDGKDSRYPQPTPKQRILAALRDIQAKEQGGAK